MSEDNSENLYYYSNKGRQYTFNLDDLTTEELKKFEKMTERQRLKFITNFELERETPFQDSVSLKPTMVEARNEKYGDYALLKAKLDELDTIQKMDESTFSDPEKMSLLDKKGNISNAYLKHMYYITEADIRNCMKAFDMKDVSLEMLKKYFNRKVESLNMTGIKTSFLEALKKFYKNLIDETQRDKHLIKKYEDYNKELEDDTDELTENKTKKIMADMQKDLSKLVNIEVKKAKISDKMIYKYLDDKEWESIRDFAEKYKLPKIVDFVSQFLEAEATAVDLMNPDLVTPEEPEKVETSDSKETELTTKEEEPKELEEKEDLPTELAEKETEKEEETKSTPTEESESLDYVGNSEKNLRREYDESEIDTNTPMKERLAEVRAEEKAEEDIIVDNFVGMRKILKDHLDKHFDPKNPKHYERTDPKNPNKKILIGTNGVAEYSIDEGIHGYGHKMVYDPIYKTYTYTYSDGKKQPKYKIIYTAGDEFADFKKRGSTPHYNIKVTVFGKGYKIKYTSGSIVDKIKDKLFKSVNTEIKGLKDEDRNIYKKLESLEKTINELKESIQKKSEIPSPPKLPAPEPVPIEKNKPSNFLDEIKNPHKPLKPVVPTPKPKIHLPEPDEYSDIKKILDDRRKDIEYSEDEDSEEEWGEGVRISDSKGRRMEILEFLKSLD